MYCSFTWKKGVLEYSLRNWEILLSYWEFSVCREGMQKFLPFLVKTLSILHFETELSYLKQRLKCQNTPSLRRQKRALPTGDWGPLALKCCCKHFQSLSLNNSGWGERQTKKKKLLWSKITTRELISYCSSTDQSASSLTEMSVTNLGASDKAHARPHWKVKWSDQAHIWF